MIALPPLAVLLSAAEPQQAQPATPPPPAAPAPLAAPPAAEPIAPVARRVEGKVTFATATTAYIDAGALEGVTIGQVVRLTRGGQPSGSCTVRETADHSSTCTGQGVRRGPLLGRDHGAGSARGGEMVPVPTEEELASRNAIVTGTPVALVESKAKPRDVVLGQLPTYRGDLGYALWLASPSGPGNSQRLQLDVQVNGLDAFAGFKFFADARLMQWTQQDQTYLPVSSTELLVYDLELAQRDPRKSWSAAFGRVMPWFAPGATVFDGAQGGMRFGRTEVGSSGGRFPTRTRPNPPPIATPEASTSTSRRPWGRRSSRAARSSPSCRTRPSFATTRESSCSTTGREGSSARAATCEWGSETCKPRPPSTRPASRSA